MFKKGFEFLVDILFKICCGFWITVIVLLLLAME